MTLRGYRDHPVTEVRERAAAAIASLGDAASEAPAPAADGRPSEPTTALPSGTYLGQLRGGVSGPLRFSLQRATINSAEARVGGDIIRLSGHASGNRLTLSGRSRGVTLQLVGKAGQRGVAGTWRGTIAGARTSGAWSAAP